MFNVIAVMTERNESTIKNAIAQMWRRGIERNMSSDETQTSVQSQPGDTYSNTELSE